jgi:hypothetical protein
MNIESQLKKVTVWECTDGENFISKIAAIHHQNDINELEKANDLLDKFFSIGDILEVAFGVLPEYIDEKLYNVNKNSKLVIEHWQCKNTPGYQPRRFESRHKMFVSGDAGAWSGPYGASITISDITRYAKDERSIL